MASPTTSSIQPALIAAGEILTVGLPFCVFKLSFGAIALGSVAPLAYALFALGAVDLVLNVANLASLAVARRRISGVCLAEVVLRGRGDLGLAFDVFLSFGLVAIAIGFGLLPRVPRWMLPIWNLAVVLNVFGAGIGRLLAAWRARRAN